MTVVIMTALSLAVGSVAEIETDAEHEEVEFKTEDNELIYGDLFVVKKGKRAPLVLLFHQASSNGRAEYAYHIPRLVENGYNVLVIDQRSGGSHFGGENRTVGGMGDENAGYCDAYPDLEAALDYVVDAGFKGSRYAWGSSYSGALVFRLGMEHPDELSGVLVFSPAVGQAMYPCSTTVYIVNNEVPAFLAATAAGVSKYSGTKERKTRKLAAAAAEYVDVFYVADNGVHGASMLDPERVGGDVEKHWSAVLNFMKSHP
jgi:alpha-beta hydrolase superfamily lysophospholipase